MVLYNKTIFAFINCLYYLVMKHNRMSSLKEYVHIAADHV